MNNKRDYNIDMVKAIAVILVVVGHIVQYICAKDTYAENLIFRYIYSFHMPLFMFISGYFSFRKGKAIDLNWLKQRFIRLMIPFLVWILPFYVYNKVYLYESFGKFFFGIVKSPDAGGLWFFEVLFLNCMCLFIAEKAKKCLNVLFRDLDDIWYSILSKGIVFAGVWIITLVGFMYLGFPLCRWHIIFYFAGCIMAEIKSMNIWDKIIGARNLWKWISIFVFPIAGFFWSQVETPAWILFFGAVGNFGYRLFVPFLGISFVWNLVPYIKDSIKNKFIPLSRYSSEIYILQFFFVRQYFHIVVIDAVLAFLLSVFLSLVIVKLVESPKIPRKLSLVLFGK